MSSLLFLRFLPALAALIAFIILVLLGLQSRRTWVKQVFYNVSAIFFAGFLFFVFQLYKQHKNRVVTKVNGEVVRSYSVPDAQLGYRPTTVDADITVEKWRRNKPVYSSSIRLENGWRVVPGSQEQGDQVLFLGGSFCFGEGLDDEETLAHQYALQLEDAYQFHNLGFHGYGPHHALRILDQKLWSNDDHESPIFLAVYRIIPDHIRRAAGYSSWDPHGPHYKISNGTLTDEGQFHPYIDPNELGMVQKILNVLREQLGVNRWLNKNKNKSASEYDVKRTALILAQIKARVEQEHGYFLLLQEPEFEQFEFREEWTNHLNDLNIPYLNIGEMDFYQRRSKSELYIANDGHPSARYNRELAVVLDSVVNHYICSVK